MLWPNFEISFNSCPRRFLLKTGLNGYLAKNLVTKRHHLKMKACPPFCEVGIVNVVLMYADSAMNKLLDLSVNVA